jgi:hypothetical protein
MIRALLTVLALSIPAAAFGQKPAQAPPVDQRVAELERKVATLEKQVKALRDANFSERNSKTTALPPPQAPAVAAPTQFTQVCENGVCRLVATGGSGVVASASVSGGCGSASASTGGEGGIWFPGKRIIGRLRNR